VPLPVVLAGSGFALTPGSIALQADMSGLRRQEATKSIGNFSLAIHLNVKPPAPWPSELPIVGGTDRVAGQGKHC
jgi:hypothetical protein